MSKKTKTVKAADFSRIEGLGGSSPALAVACPVALCGAAVGNYCTKMNGGRQGIAHKKRRELATQTAAAQRREQSR